MHVLTLLVFAVAQDIADRVLAPFLPSQLGIRPRVRDQVIQTHADHESGHHNACQGIAGYPSPRRMTHDLLASVIEKLGGAIEKIEINNLQDHTFFAVIHIKQDGQVLKIDSRPSDAIALGIATTVPIFVAEHVLDEVC